MSELSADEQAAMVAIRNRVTRSYRAYDLVTAASDGVENGFIAGLRYRDGAEPSEAEVEAAAEALAHGKEDHVYGWKPDARAALEAARNAKAPA